MTMRVFSGSLATETNTFAPMPTGLEAFKDRGYFPAGQHPRELTFFSGPLCALREVAPQRGWTLIKGAEKLWSGIPNVWVLDK